MAAISANRSKSREIPVGERSFAAGHAQENEPVIDLVHLARQTLSDQALERELLGMFERQSARIVAQLVDGPSKDAKIRRDLAHMLKGSALAIGAGRVARSAQLYETNCAAAPGGAGAAALERLAEAVTEARATIGRLLG
jgi:HPt (histidine-containing phosphotransfer) domain-containing protein